MQNQKSNMNLARAVAGYGFLSASFWICAVAALRLIVPNFDRPRLYWGAISDPSLASLLWSNVGPLCIAAIFLFFGYVLALKKRSDELDDETFVISYSAHGGIRTIIERSVAGLNLLWLVLMTGLFALNIAIPLFTGRWFELNSWAAGGWFAAIPFLLTWACWDALLGQKLVLSKRGIDIDRRGPASAMTLGFQWFLPWSDLHSVTILKRANQKTVKGANNKLRGKLVMDFGSGASRYLDLSRLKKHELDGLFQAFERWADKLTFSPEVLALKDYVLLGEEQAHPEDRKSFTEIWESSLNTRHSSTAYLPLAPGQKLQDGRLSVISQVCSSGLSAVYLGQNKQNERIIIKECFIAPSANDKKRAKAEELFKREASMLAHLEHPQIAKLRDVFEENGRSYIVMEHIPGTNLRQYIALKGPQPEPVVLAWAKHILQVLQYLHEQSPPVVHRDLTPDNIVLSSDEKIYVVDFGAANEFLGKATGTLIGKQCYIAPEQFRGKAQVQSDIYALGATMHYLLTGQDPEPLEESRPIEINTDISLETTALVEWCTKQEAELRPLCARDAIEAIDNLLQSLGSASQPGEGEAVALGLKQMLMAKARRE